MTTRSFRPAILVLAGIYFAAAKFGFTMAFTAEQVTLVWAPSGLALAALLLYGIELWPGILIGAFLANASAHEPIAVAVAIATGNTLEAVVAVWLLHRFVGFGTAIDRLKQAVGLVVYAAGVSTIVSATVGVTSLCLGHVQPWAEDGNLWWTWWLGDAAGDLLIAPAVLSWRAWPQLWQTGRRLEAGSLAAGLLVASGVVFSGQFTTGRTYAPLEYTVFPFVIWAAIRFGVAGAAMVNILTASVAIWGTVNGFGPSAFDPIQERLVLLQVFMSVVAATGLLLGAVISERDGSARRRHAEYMVTLVLGAMTSVDEATRQVLQIACEHLDWDIGLLWRVETESHVMRCAEVWQPPPRSFPQLERLSRSTALTLGSDLPGRVWAEEQPSWIADLHEKDGSHRLLMASAEGLRGAFAFPIRVDRELLGVFEFFSESVREPDTDLLQMFTAVAAEVGQFVARKRVERQVRESEARKAAVLEASLDCIITIDHEGRIVEFNPAAEQTFGYRRADVLGRDMAELIIPSAFRCDYRQDLARHFQSDGNGDPGRRFETTAKRSDGTEFPVELSIARIASLGQPLLTAYLRDITEQKQMVKQLAFRASHDGLTQALNRASFIERLREATDHAADRGGYLIAVLFVDTDRFKDINDRFGHLVGDRLLVAIARRLQASVRPADAVGRLGGDEFAILLERVTDLRDATAVADRVQESLKRPFELDGHQIVATVSIGVTLSPTDGVQAEDLLRAADAAMYDAKAVGPGHYKVLDRRGVATTAPPPDDRSASSG